MRPLPIDEVIPEIVSLLRSAGKVVIEAPPGAGKTTRVPWAVMEAGIAPGEIVVVQPRRLAAKLAASHVSSEHGVQIGQTVGYTVRFDSEYSKKTRIQYITDGVLLRMLADNPSLDGVGMVIFDEFHERRIGMDIGLAMAKRLRFTRRKDLLIAVMSATLDAKAVADWLDAPKVRSEGRVFEITVEHLLRPPVKDVWELAAAGCRDMVRSGVTGDILVFMPGAREISKTVESLSPFCAENGIELHPLHGEMSLKDQAAAVNRSARRKIIISTNIAETSVTIDGVTAVIDSGMARVSGHSSWTGLPTLALSKISKASAIQRAGRAGRTAPGTVLRLYTKADFESRPQYNVPEIKTSELSDTILFLKTSCVDPVSSFDWFEPPPASSVSQAGALLERLGAIDAHGKLTDPGLKISRFPVHPRLGRLLVEGERRGVYGKACIIAALISEEDVRAGSRVFAGSARRRTRLVGSDRSDLLDSLDLFESAVSHASGGNEPPDSGKAARAFDLDGRAFSSVFRLSGQLMALRHGRDSMQQAREKDQETGLLISVLSAFPDRVARRRAPGSHDLILSGGGSARLSGSSAAIKPMFLVAVDIEHRRGSGTGPARTVVDTASAIEPEWLIDLFPDRIVESVRFAFNQKLERVERSETLSYDNLVLEESIAPSPPCPEASAVLKNEALAKGIDYFDPKGRVEQMLARVQAATGGENPAINGAAWFADPSAVLAAACENAVSFDVLGPDSLVGLVLSSLDDRQRSSLSRLAPETLKLPSGREMKIHYERGKPPWVESYLQDFFGMKATPAVGSGLMKLTIHLLAPSRRPVQVTSDLEGFWKNHYPSIRRELCRKYPKYNWPEDGASAAPKVRTGQKAGR